MNKAKAPFINKVSAKEATKEAILKREQSVIDMAAKCVATDEFKTYRADCITTKNGLLSMILNLEEVDPIRYAFAMKSLIERYRAVTLLLRAVETDLNGVYNEA